MCPYMRYARREVKETIESIGFLYDEDLVFPSTQGCVMNINDKDNQAIYIKFKENNNHIIHLKLYSTIVPKLLKHKEGRTIWNDRINKHRNIKKLINKI